MVKSTEFQCTACGAEYPLHEMRHRCEACGEPLEVKLVTDGRIHEGKGLERYADFFPFEENLKEYSLEEGETALVVSERLAKHVGIAGLHFKNESQNPTWSFKDRGTHMGLLHARALGYDRIGTVSTGNMAPSVAAYGSKAGVETFVMVSESIPEEKLNPISIYGPHLIKVQGDYGKMYYESLKIGENCGIYFINSDSPFRVEGSKTIAFEICQQLDFKMPDYVVVPTSAGGNIRGIEKGFREFYESGLIDRIPRMVCAQADGCKPIVEAFEKGYMEIKRYDNPETVAHAIENPLPPSGNQVLRMLSRNGGLAISVTDEEILSAQLLMARDGLFGQPASCVPLAALIKLRKQKRIEASATAVCVLTGSGLKYTAIFDRHDLKSDTCALKDLKRHIEEKY